ncbi:MAG: C40 family peptidase [Pyrinomonadaceae bacterium]|nr:C40 family peptidase [Pyrinomonadaceae bacterium]
MVYSRSLVKYSSFVLFAAFFFVSTVDTVAQERDRVVKPKVKKTTSTRPVTSRRGGLTNRIVVRNGSKIKKTSSSRAVNSASTTSSYMSATTRSMMLDSIRKKIGIRYRYGTQGPRSYDCSGFIWKVFNEAGIDMIRTSAREFWRKYEPATGDERFEFGTLVFFNRLGHVGIVADKNGFYHASSSKGVTYSKFRGYWSKRIVGYRRVPIEMPKWSELEDNEPVDQDQ